MNSFYGLAACSFSIGLACALPVIASLAESNVAGALLWAVPLLGGIAGGIYGAVVGRRL
jgi:hypothetical protein